MTTNVVTCSQIMFSIIQTRSFFVAGRRQFSTSKIAGFKFKLTEEMSKEFEEQQSKLKKDEPEQALHTKESSLIMGRVSHDRYKNIVKCAVPKYRLNEFLLMYIKENDNVQALDDNNVSNPGDWVLLRRDETIVDNNVRHRIEKVVHQYGNYIDPLTNRRSFGLYYDDDLERLEKIKIDI